MKAFKPAMAVCALASLLTFACKKNNDFIFKDSPKPANEVNSASLVASASGSNATDISAMTFCAATTVPICAGQSMNVGSVSVQTGLDGRTYITYQLNGPWYFKELHLYAGPDGGIPVNRSGNPVPGQFPFKYTCTAPYNVQTYTFAIDGLPDSYVVAAHCSVARISNGTIVDQQTGWGDGCSGKRIGSQGNWGTYFTATSASCTALAAGSEDIDICSRPVNKYFGTDPVYNQVIPWNQPDVAVAGYDYSEQEGRAIANTVDANGQPNDSKYGYMRVATLRLSRTDFLESPTLAPAVATIESWLATQGKLTPSHLPTGNSQVRNAAKIINAWIDTHICPER